MPFRRLENDIKAIKKTAFFIKKSRFFQSNLHEKRIDAYRDSEQKSVCDKACHRVFFDEF